MNVVLRKPVLTTLVLVVLFDVCTGQVPLPEPVWRIDQTPWLVINEWSWNVLPFHLARQDESPNVLRVHADSTVYFIDDNTGRILSSQDVRNTNSQLYVRGLDRWIRHDTIQSVVSGVRSDDSQDSVAYDILGRSSFPGTDPSTCWSLYTNGNLKLIDVTKRQVLRIETVPLEGIDPYSMYLYAVLGDSVVIYIAATEAVTPVEAIMKIYHLGEPQPRISHRLRSGYHTPVNSTLIYSSAHDAYVFVEFRSGRAYAVMVSEHSPTRELALEAIVQASGNQPFVIQRAKNDSILVVLQTGSSSYSLVDLYAFQELPGPKLDDVKYDAMDVYDDGMSVGFFYGGSYGSQLKGFTALNLGSMETVRVATTTHVRPLYNGEHYLMLGADLSQHYVTEFSTGRTSIDPWLFGYPRLATLPLAVDSPLAFYSRRYRATAYPPTLAEWADGYHWLEQGVYYRDVRFPYSQTRSLVELAHQEDLPIASTRRDQIEVFDEELNHHIASIRVYRSAPRLLMSSDRRWLITKQGARRSQAFSVDHFGYPLGDPDLLLCPYQEADRKDYISDIADCDLSRASNMLYYATEDGHLVALSLNESFERDTVISTLRGPHWVDVSPDGTRLAVIDSLELRVLDVPSQQVISRFIVPKSVHSFCWSEDSKSFYIGSEQSVYAKYGFKTTHVREDLKTRSEECDPVKVFLRGGQLELFGAGDEYSLTIADVSGRILTSWQGTQGSSPVMIPIPSHAQQVLLIVVSGDHCTSVQAVVNTASH